MGLLRTVKSLDEIDVPNTLAAVHQAVGAVFAVAPEVRLAAETHASAMSRIATAVTVVGFVIATAVLYHTLKDVFGVE